MKISKSLSKIGLIALITFVFMALPNATFAQNNTDNKQTITIQDTIVKSLPWKKEYNLPENDWITLNLEEQKGWIKDAGFDVDKAYAEQYNRMIEQYKKLKGIKNDTIQKKK